MANSSLSGFSLEDLNKALNSGLGLQQRINQAGNKGDVGKVPSEVCTAICSPFGGWSVNAPYRLVRCRHGFSVSFTEIGGTDSLNIAFLQMMHRNYMKIREDKSVN